MFDGQDNNFDMFAQENAVDEARVAIYLAKVMGWMCIGLFTTLVVGLLCLSSPAVTGLFLYTNAIYAVCLAQLAVVAAMSFASSKVGPGAATVLFMVYSALTGVTFSSLFILFETASLIYVFAVTAFIFITMSVYGFSTRRDLTRVGTLALFGLMGIIVAGLLNFFLGSSLLDFGITCVGIVIFIALIAYDTQKIKDIYIEATMAGYDEDSPEIRKLSIYGALNLYLDFINLFLKLLRLVGRRRG